MRTLAWTLTATIAVVGACGDDDSNTDAGVEGDGGGGVDTSIGDATPSIDASPVAAVAGTVTITVLGDGNPVSGIDIVWFDPDGAVVDHEATNIAGQASEDLFAGSSVTIAVMAGPSRYMITYLGVEPGDDLVWQFGGPTPAQVSILSATLQTPFATADRYVVQIGCAQYEVANTGTPVTGEIFDDCLGSDQTIDVVAVAFNGDIPLAYDHATGVTVVDQGTTSVTLGAWQTVYDPLAFTLTNAPNDVGGVGVETHVRLDGVEFIGPGGGGGVSNGTVSITSGYWQGLTIDPIQYLSFIGRGTMQNPEGIAILLGSKAGAPAAISHDLAALLPTISAAGSADSSGQLEISWTSSGAFDAADGMLFINSWTDNAVNYASYVMAPPNAASPLVLPLLPAALTAYRTTGTAVFQTPTMIAAEADFMAGYTAFRVDGWRIFGDGAFDLLPAGDGLIIAQLGGAMPGGGNAPIVPAVRLDSSAMLPAP